METKEKIEQRINKLLSEKLFAGIRKIIVGKQKDRLLRTKEYISATHEDKKLILSDNYKIWYSSVSNLFLNFHSIFALKFLVLRELQIRDFLAKEVVRVKADYTYNGISFSAYFPTHFDSTMTKEIEDCISELNDFTVTHTVDNYIPKSDTERAPHEPLTTAELKYSCFYLFGFEPGYVSKLSLMLHDAGLITYPETNGWRIESETTEDIITALNQKFSEEQVLQYKRVFTDRAVDREEEEAIYPTNILGNYYPKVIAKTSEFQSIATEEVEELSDLQKMYEFIFYLTLSIQMKNSIYDTSVIEIAVGDKTLKEQAHIIIKDQENWELLTGVVNKRIAKNSEYDFTRTVVLPEIKPGTKLVPTDIYSYSYHSRRLPRYGVGRFVTQILEKNNIGGHQKHDAILENLSASKAVSQVKTMLHPQENAVILVEWLKEHMPLMLDIEYLAELEDKIDAVYNGSLSLDSLVGEIQRMIDSAFESSGFVLDDSAPSDAKKRLLKSVALKHGLELSNDIYLSNVRIDMVLAQYPTPEPIKIGLCPSCNAEVFQREYINRENGEVSYFFSCENYGQAQGACKFTIWDSYVYKFFSDKAMELHGIAERAGALKKILSKKNGYLYGGLIGKNEKPYDAKVFIQKGEDRKTKNERWSFSMTFVNKRK